MVSVQDLGWVNFLISQGVVSCRVVDRIVTMDLVVDQLSQASLSLTGFLTWLCFRTAGLLLGEGTS